MSSAVIGSLRVNLGMDSAEFHNGAKKAQGALAGLSSSIKGFAAGAVAALSFGAVTASIRSAINHMDDLGKTAQKIGIPVEQLSSLEYAAKLADISIEGLQTSVTKFSRSLAEIASGGKNDAGSALKAIGVSATDATGKLRPTTAIIADIAEEFSTMKDGAEKTAIAVALFGRSGAEMIPLLNGGKKALAEANAEAKAFGIIVSEQSAVAAEQFNDNITRLTSAGQGLTNQVAEAMLPALVDVTDAMVDFAKEGTFAEQVTSALKFIMTETARFIIEASAAWKEITIWMTAAGQALEAITDGRIQDIGQIWKTASKTVALSWENAARRIAVATGEMQRSAEGKGELPSTLRTRDAPLLPSSGTGKKKTGSTSFQFMDPNQHPLYGGKFKEFSDEVLEGFNAMQEASDLFKSGLDNLIDGLIDGTMSLKDGFRSMAESMLKDMTKLFANQALMQLFKPSHALYGGGGGFLSDLFGSLFKGLPSFDVGTRYVPRDMTANIHKGEMILPRETADAVRKGGMGSGSLNVVINNNSTAKVSASRNGDGGLRIDVDDIVARAIGSGKADKAMARFGLAPRKVTR